MKFSRQILLFILILCASGVLFYLPYQEVKEQNIEGLNVEQRTLARQAATGIQELFAHYTKMLQYFACHLGVVNHNEQGRNLLYNLYAYTRIVAANPGQKAIIVNGFAQSVEVRKTQELGAGQYVKKPYILEQLGLAVRETLHR
ncbi:MAG: hypothetical protein JXO49_09760 [Deltaproteobacteria bacterium]|nr:hypothetical protein [Candidatus Anaeroferrophillus wilburensis]MBN2889617.1 hypothetical protein [Deltaproteobacteria bacterium]